MSVKMKSTERAYKSDWERFSTWCAGEGLLPLPATPATILRYLEAIEPDHKFSTMLRRPAAITARHRDEFPNAGPPPTKAKAVWNLLDRIAAEKGALPEQKQPLGSKKQMEMIAAWKPESLPVLSDQRDYRREQ